jgi:tetratricopeptide (TPR) repeat protein
MRRLSFLLLLIAACTVGLQAQIGGPSSISKQTELLVRILYENGRPVGANIRVEVQGAYGGMVTFGNTDTSGMVRFSRLEPGKYKLHITGDGVATKDTGEIDLTDVGPRYTYQVQVEASSGPGQASSGFTLDASIPPDAGKEFDKGNESIKSKDWASAQKHLEKAVSIYPKYAAAQNFLGVVYLNLKMNEKAVEAFKTAAQLDDHSVEANRYLGEFYYENHDLKQAEPYLQHATSDEPKNAQLLLALANCQLRNGEPDQALATAQKVHALPDHKKYAAAHLISGQVLADKGNAKGAADEYRLFLKEDPNSPMAPKVKDAVAQLETASK